MVDHRAYFGFASIFFLLLYFIVSLLFCYNLTVAARWPACDNTRWGFFNLTMALLSQLKVTVSLPQTWILGLSYLARQKRKGLSLHRTNFPQMSRSVYCCWMPMERERERAGSTFPILSNPCFSMLVQWFHNILILVAEMATPSALTRGDNSNGHTTRFFLLGRVQNNSIPKGDDGSLDRQYLVLRLFSFKLFYLETYCNYLTSCFAWW